MDGGLFDVICDRKDKSPVEVDNDEPSALQSQERSQESQNKINKNSCAWLREEAMFEFQNHSGIIWIINVCS